MVDGLDNPMVRPRPPVAFGLFSISLGGIGLMTWGLDQNHGGVLFVGWALAFLGGGLTTWIYWEEISKLCHPSRIERAARGETVVASVIIMCAFLLPPYIYSLRASAAKLTLESTNAYISPDILIVENFDFRNGGDLAAIGFNRGCYHQTSDKLLTLDEEKKGMNLAYRNMNRIEVSGFPHHLESNYPMRTSCTFQSNQSEYEAIKTGHIYLYMYLYSEYYDEKLPSGMKHIFLECHFFKGRFDIRDACNGFKGTYTVPKDEAF
jgi:hypothetical protein